MSSAEAAVESSAPSPIPVIPGSFRHTVLTSAKRFKSTWVELGKLLVKVRDAGSFQEWGFDSFESYCYKELHIRKATALKLTRSFSFLNKREPEMVEDSEQMRERAPAFEVVEVLADADERGQISDKEYKSIRDSIWNAERPTSELKKELVERFPRPEAPTPSASIQLRRFASGARKLAAELKGTRRVPSAIAERAAALADDLEELAGQQDG